MALDELMKARFDELSGQLNALRSRQTGSGMASYLPAEWQRWASSAQHLIRNCFGEDSTHHRNFTTAYNNCHGWDYEVEALKGIFLAAQSDYIGGYAFSFQAALSAEIFGDFVVLAKNALSEGAKDVAAVLACAALEDALKKYAALQGLQVSDKVMQEVVGALKSKGLVSGAQKSLLDTMPKIRDYAMHANWSKITEQDVGSVIGFVEQFLLTKLA